LLIVVCGLSASSTARADALSAVQVLREGGCGGTQSAAPSLRHDASLDHAARLWAEGATLEHATLDGGYVAERTAGLHVSGADTALLDTLRRSGCRTIGNRALEDIGIYRNRREVWLVLGSPYAIPARSQAPLLASRTLVLVNAARARGADCGNRAFAPAPPLRLSAMLADVALGHAADMAAHDYFEHQDRAGHSPAERVRAVGYRESLVGENIAYGPETPEEVVRGWLDSPGHCENIMDPRFAEMGIAYSPGSATRRGLFWVQLLAAPGRLDE
jgi:uncharacterized protein YkwD